MNYNFNSLFSSSLIIYALWMVLLGSCVSNKKLVYLQNDDFKGDVNYDSIISIHKLTYEDYKLKPGDIISLRIGSLTPSEFNFIKDYEEQLGLIRKLNQYQQNSFTSGRNQNRFNAGIGDESISFNQFSADRFLSGFALNAKGELYLPEIGAIDLSDKTIVEAENVVQDSLQGYFETPVVRIQLMSFHFSIFGEVENEGRYTTYDPMTNIFDAIALAGNLTEFADRSRLKLIRYTEDKATTVFINPLNEDIISSEYFYLRPNDQIIVPPLKARESRTYLLPNTAIFLALTSTFLAIIILITR